MKFFTVGKLPVHQHETISELASHAAEAAAAVLAEGIRARGEAAAIIATGNSQDLFLDHLMARSDVEWDKVTLFHMDEYLGLSADHPASFRRYLMDRVARRVGPAAVHLVEGDAAEPIKECERYGTLLASAPIDLCCLGIGENGHLAFNDPPVADFEDPRLVKIVRLDAASRLQQVGEGHFPDLASVPAYALTLTIPALFLARRVLTIVPEKRKAEAVRRSLRGPVSTDCPGSYLCTRDNAELFLDADSASLLEIR